MALPPGAAERIAALAAEPAVCAALAWPAHAEAEIAEETTRITEVPAPTFHESARAVHVAERLYTLGLDDVEVAADGNVYARLGGGTAGDRPALAVFAHLDTVFPGNVAVKVARREGRLYAPGVGDNSAGVAGLLCAFQAMRAADLRPERPVWIVGTVGEEGLGNLRGARAATERLFDGLEAVLSIEGSFFGRVSHTAVGSQRWRVSVKGEGGHSWHDFGQPSAVHLLVQAAAAIARLEMASEPRTTFNIGEIRGGTGVNVIAECAEMVLDMRSVDPVRLSDLTFRVRRILDGIRGRGIGVEIERVGDRPAGAIPVTHPLVQACSAVLAHLGVRPQYAAASTDSNAPLGRGIPAVTLGVTRGGGAHTLGEWIEVAPMVRGIQQLILTLCALSRGPDLVAVAEGT